MPNVSRDFCSSCGAPSDRKGQRLCRQCHATAMREFRKHQRDELMKLRAFRSAHAAEWDGWLARHGTTRPRPKSVTPRYKIPPRAARPNSGSPAAVVSGAPEAGHRLGRHLRLG